jgi:hypothetical protein
MSTTILAISDDPNSGCMLIIGQNIKLHFDSMGSPWRTQREEEKDNKGEINPLNLSLDEITALMSMDGATCLFSDNNRPAISFRNIVKVSNSPVNRKIEKRTIENILDGEGSRKWSAATAATMKEVDLVIAVSQDGPIYLYYPTDDDNTINIDKI